MRYGKAPLIGNTLLCGITPTRWLRLCRPVIPVAFWVLYRLELSAVRQRHVAFRRLRGTKVGTTSKTWGCGRIVGPFGPVRIGRLGWSKESSAPPVRSYSKRMTERVIVFIEAYLAKRIVAGGFIGSCSCKSRGMRKGDKLKSRYRRLCLRPLEQRSLAIYQRYALGRLSACYQSCRRQGGAR